jgi:FtsZ-binding cell division protein ZapB
VSEVVFIMEATLHLMVEQLRELKSAVNAGHLELKAEINAVTAGQEELKMEMNAGQEELKAQINAVSAAKRNSRRT